MTDITLENENLDRLATLIAEKLKPKEVLSVEEASEYLGIGRDTITNLARSGRLKSKDFGTEKKARYRFRREWLDEYLEEA